MLSSSGNSYFSKQKTCIISTMGIKQDNEESLEKFDISKIDGQPTDEDMNQLT